MITHGQLSYGAGDKPAPKDVDRIWHDANAKTVTAVFALQVKMATELGLAAASRGFSREDNPFAEARLSGAWESGWVVGDAP